MAGPADRSDSGSASALQAVFEQLRSAHTLSLTLTHPLCLAVIALDRCLSAQHPAAESYSYDLTVTDGRWRIKCQLVDSLNRWVRTGSLRCGAGVLVSQLSMVHDETRLSHSYIRIDNIHSVAELPERFLSIKDVGSIPEWCQDHVTRSDGPLQLSRKYYLPLWINDDPYGSVWVPYSPPPDVVIDGMILFSFQNSKDCLRFTVQPPKVISIMYPSLPLYLKPLGFAHLSARVFYLVCTKFKTMEHFVHILSFYLDKSYLKH